MNIVVMVDKLAGNESVGDRWTETYIFETTDTLLDVMEKIGCVRNIAESESIQQTVRLQIGIR